MEQGDDEKAALDAYDDRGEEEDEDYEEEDDELAQAARAGIRLLEENGQLQDEVQHLRAQVASVESEKNELLRLLEERNLRIEKLSSHLRETIRESQGVSAELVQAKQRVAGYQQLLQAQAAAASVIPRSPGRGKRSKSLPRKMKEQQQSDSESCSSGSSSKCSTPTRGGITSPQQMKSSDREEGETVVRLVASPRSMVAVQACQGDPAPNDSRSSRLTISIPPPSHTVASTQSGGDDKMEAERRKTAAVRNELANAQRQIIELRASQLKAQGLSKELEVARDQVLELEQQLEAAREERVEERELISSLQSTIEVYQCLDHPLRNTTVTAGRGLSRSMAKRRASGTLLDSGMDLPNDRLGEDLGRTAVEMPSNAIRHRRRSDGCVIPLNATALSDSLTSSLPILDDRFNLRDENERLVSELDHLSKQVLNLKVQDGFSRVVHSVAAVQDAQPKVSETYSPVNPDTYSHCVGPVGLGGGSRLRQTDHQLAVLQDLLKRFRSQWKHERNARRSAEAEKMLLLSRVEKMQVTLSHLCESCHHASAGLLADEYSVWDESATTFKALLESASQCEGNKELAEEIEATCFAILHRLMDSWTSDSSKRMQLHDWLMNAIRGTGKERPLYLYDLSSEIATGFQALMAPILREKFGVQIKVEKRLRHVITTDLKLEVADRSPAKAKAAHQRISRSLLWLADKDSSWIERKEWVGDYVRQHAAATYNDD